MDRDQYRAWLAELTANDLRRRRAAEPELARKEAALQAAHADLAKSQAASQEIEAELNEHVRQADASEGG